MDPKLLERYQSKSGAAAYRSKYDRSWIRRLSHRREMSILRRALLRADAKGPLLDCPCGAGRLVPTLLGVVDQVTCADISAEMVDEARDALTASGHADRVTFAVAGAAELPFEDDAFDTAVCHRLIHHMPTAEERAGVFRELARVTRRRLVLSFSDDSTRKGRSQRRRGVHRRRYALMPDALYAEVGAHGLEPIGTPLRLNTFSSLVAIIPLRLRAPAAP